MSDGSPKPRCTYELDVLSSKSHKYPAIALVFNYRTMVASTLIGIIQVGFPPIILVFFMGLGVWGVCGGTYI